MGGKGTPFRFAELTAIHVLLIAATLEVVIARVAIPLLRPAKGAPPAWHTALDYFALFTFYFTGALAVAVLAVRCATTIQAWREDRSTVPLASMIAHAIIGLTTIVIASVLLVKPPPWFTLVIELGFAVSIIAIVVVTIGKGRDLGAMLGVGLVAIPLAIHTVRAIGGELIWPENHFDGWGPDLERYGVIALALVALITPYCFAPRPFSRAVTRPVPVIIAMGIATIGAVFARMSYPTIAKGIGLAIGVELAPGQADPKLALYLLSVATLAWTLASCAVAQAQTRRTIGAGLAFVILGGYQFKFAHHWLLPMLGLAMIADAARYVRDDEAAAIPIDHQTPPISDATWSTYVGAIVTGLKRSLQGVHSLTTRGDDGLSSSTVVGEAAGRNVRLRIDRIENCVLGVDIVIGREIDEARTATLAVWAYPPKGTGANPPAPPAAPQLESGDIIFDERFKARGSAAALAKLFDENTRAHAVAKLDGWVAFWDGEGLRYRVYPNRGAQLDHPIPVSDLAQNKVTSAERLCTVVELLVELANRGLPTVDVSEAPPVGDDDSDEVN